MMAAEKVVVVMLGMLRIEPFEIRPWWSRRELSGQQFFRPNLVRLDEMVALALKLVNFGTAIQQNFVDDRKCWTTAQIRRVFLNTFNQLWILIILQTWQGKGEEKQEKKANQACLTVFLKRSSSFESCKRCRKRLRVKERRSRKKRQIRHVV